MKVTIEFQSEILASQEELFNYFEHGLVFNRLTPPWKMLKVIHRDPVLKVGCATHFQLKIGWIKKDFVVRQIESTPPYGFADRQEIGPFKSYTHHYIFTKKKDKTYLIDHLEYELYGRFFGHIIGSWYVKRAFKQMFRYRHKVISEDFKHLSLEKDRKRLKVLLSGSHGFVGQQLSIALDLFGFDIYFLVRDKPKHAKEIFWDIENKKLDHNALEGFDYIIHLCGESVSDKKWSKSVRKKIYQSRVDSTHFLAKTLQLLKKPPQGFFVASGIHVYGHRPNQDLDESSPAGEGFLSRVVSDWEKASHEFTKGRVVNLRFGMILGLRGGALKRLIKFFSKNLGVITGDGTQHISWIVIDDLIYQIFHLLCDKTSEGVYNLVSPNPVTNLELSQTLAKILRKFLLFKVPKKFISLVLGERGKTLLLSDIKAYPKRLVEKNVYFSYPKLFTAIKHLLGK